LLLGDFGDDLDDISLTLVGRNLIASNTAGGRKLSDDRSDNGAREDGDSRLVLGNETSDSTGVSKDNNEVNLKVKDGGDGGGSNGLTGAEGSGGVHLHVGEELLVVNAALGLTAGSGHDGDSLDGVGSVGGLTGKHDAISTVEDSIGNIRGLSTGGSGGGDHGLKHLGGGLDGLTGDVTLFNHPLLGDEDLLWGDFHTEVTTGNHDTVTNSEDLVKVVETGLVLDLGDDLNVGTTGTEDITDEVDVVGGLDEGGGDHVNVVLEAEFGDVVLVLL